MPTRIVLRVLQAVFIVTALVLIIPTVTLVTEGMNSGGTATQECTTTTNSSGTTSQTCQVPVAGNKVDAGIAYALMSISAALGAVAMRPDSGIGRRIAGGQQPPVVPTGAPPFPPQGPQAPQGSQAQQNRGW